MPLNKETKPNQAKLKNNDLLDLHGKYFMVYGDLYTAWLDVVPLSSRKSRVICDAQRNWFCIYSVSEELFLDGWELFDSHEYDLFHRDWGIKKQIYYIQRDELAELAFKTAKIILIDRTDVYGH